MTSIYTLSDPRNEQVRYVGKTSMDLNTRLRRHVVDTRRNPEKVRWISELKSLGLEPKMDLVEDVSEKNWKEEERFYISYFKFLGFDLLNKTVGGDGHGMKMTKEAIQKMVESRRNGKGFGMSAYNRQKLDAKLIERKNRPEGFFTVEQRENLSIKNRDHLNAVRHLALNRDKFKKPIGQYDKDGNLVATFSGVRETQKQFANHQNIMFVLKGKGKTAYGFTWKYLPKLN